MDPTDTRAKLNQFEIEQYYKSALTYADALREIVLKFWKKGAAVSEKKDKTLVTEADFAVEAEFRRLLERDYPQHGVLGEEQGSSSQNSPFQWIIDPIDGTQSFVHRVPTFGTMFALFYKSKPLVGILDLPVMEERFSAGFGLGAYCNDKRSTIQDCTNYTTDSNEIVCTAARKQWEVSNSGASFDQLAKTLGNFRIYYDCFGLAQAVSGRAGAMIEINCPPWDIAPCQILTEEAGGKCLEIGSFVAQSGLTLRSIIFGKPSIVQELSGWLSL